MSKKVSKPETEDDLRPEYDFSTMRIVARGPKRKAPKPKVVRLEPDLAKAFPDDESVNEALRVIAKAGKQQASRVAKAAARGRRQASRLRRAG